MTVGVPDLRIVDEALAKAVDDEVARRARPDGRGALGGASRKRHLLSGLIKCGSCRANYTTVGKDYYRCARNRKRGTCDNARTVKVAKVEEAALSALQSRLLTPELAEVFVKEFTREVARLARTEAATTLRDVIGSITVNLDEAGRPVLEWRRRPQRSSTSPNAERPPAVGRGGVQWRSYGDRIRRR